MHPPPPETYTFPYTTLFRSPVDARKLRFSGSRRSPVTKISRRQSWGKRRSRADRKSTRLNSSHTVISYAVFCLKKKKKKSNRKRQIIFRVHEHPAERMSSGN